MNLKDVDPTKLRFAEWLFSGIVVAVLCHGGCDTGAKGDRLPIYGKVTIGDEPVQSGSICYLPTGDTSGPAAYTAIKNGKYRFTRSNGPVLGSHEVLVTIAPDDPNIDKNKNKRRQFPIEKTYRFRLRKDGPREFDFEIPSR